ncbi:hypothetical protein PU629_07435 [Pullulanibacillus sp. KACC 23026]|uniref:hypothetical protein n=1 Tax=Pullulanibacillus sp. KACC 23026 TaxID=3028315 RepID=UPI0023B08074|nr:hypothetical protein [Pullulanibacillus sp. KACC 23026]WEG14190.1 hypothetical protein PU629_07435 [Pullulanibacillus sp. KACC 23026]
MKEEFAQFLLKRIGKKLDDVINTPDYNGEEIITHVEDIRDYLTQLTHLMAECITWFF